MGNQSRDGKQGNTVVKFNERTEAKTLIC